MLRLCLEHGAFQSPSTTGIVFGASPPASKQNRYKSADSNSAVAQGACTAGELVGTGAQLVALGKFLPQTKSIVGSVARSGAVGGTLGGVLQPSEGINLVEERAHINGTSQNRSEGH